MVESPSTLNLNRNRKSRNQLRETKANHTAEHQDARAADPNATAKAPVPDAPENPNDPKTWKFETFTTKPETVEGHLATTTGTITSVSGIVGFKPGDLVCKDKEKSI